MKSSVTANRTLEANILQLELKIIEMSKRPKFYEKELSFAKTRLRALRRNAELARAN